MQNLVTHIYGFQKSKKKAYICIFKKPKGFKQRANCKKREYFDPFPLAYSNQKPNNHKIYRYTFFQKFGVIRYFAYH